MSGLKRCSANNALLLAFLSEPLSWRPSLIGVEDSFIGVEENAATGCSSLLNVSDSVKVIVS